MEKPHELDSFPRGGRAPAVGFNPIIQQRTYAGKDVVGLLNGAAVLDLCSDIVVLKPIPTAYLEEIEASPTFKLCLDEYEPRTSTEQMKRKDFRCLPLRVENVIIAISVSLWRTTLRSNDLIEAAREYFMSDLDETRRRKKNKLPIRMLFGFLNKMYVDVVVMSTERERVAVFRARPLKHKRLLELGNTDVDISLLKGRTLVALEFDVVSGIWSPMRLAPPSSLPLPLQVSQGGRTRVGKHEVFDETQLGSQFLSTMHMMKSHADSLSLIEAAQSGNMDTLVFDRTFYTPQMVPVKSTVDATNAGDKDERAAAQESPFAGLRYPNINQLDLQLWAVLRRGLHPTLQRNRIRCVLTFPLALLTFCLGLALIIYLKVSLEACFYYTLTDVCVHTSEETSIENCNSSFLNTTNRLVLDESVNAFLFGYAASPGTFILTVTCCMFVAALMAVGVSYFATRTLATGSSHPLFYVIMMIMHVVLGAVGCGFSAYAVYVFSHKSHSVPCSWFDADSESLCTEAMNLCPGIVIQVHLPHTSLAALILSILLLGFCTVQFLASFIPPMPDRNAIEALEKTRPETYVFYPSAYAPDGISKVEKRRLRLRIAQRLRTQLGDEVKLHNFLLTRSATIGEMMRVNCAQSLKGGEVLEPTSHDQPEEGSIGSPQRPLHYMVVLDDSSKLGGVAGGQHHQRQRKRSNEERVVVEGKRRRREIPSNLLTEVEAISRRVRAPKKKHMET